MIQEDGLMGMTSNPQFFEKAITGSKDYADILESPEQEARRQGCLKDRYPRRAGSTDIFSRCTTDKRRDGYVSLESRDVGHERKPR